MTFNFFVIPGHVQNVTPDLGQDVIPGYDTEPGTPVEHSTPENNETSQDDEGPVVYGAEE